MPLAAVMMALGANIVGVMPVPLERPGILPAPAAATKSSLEMPDFTAAPPERKSESLPYPDTYHPEAATAPDLVVRLGDRRTGPQFELGALRGGGSATRLVHVGVGFDF